MTINATKLEEVLVSCLYKEGESIEGHIPVQGVMADFGFHPQRLEAARPYIIECLSNLPEPFFAKSERHPEGKDGWSFLNLCCTKDNNLWGQHRNCEQLCVLAIGLGLAHWTMPRDMWGAFPGGMPYFTVH